MSRRLTGEERALWDRFSRSVRPLGRRAVELPDKPLQPRPEAQRSKSAKAAHLPVRPPKTKPPSLTPIEDRTLRRLARGLSQVDARLDLHGMRQERAFSTLVSFLRRSQARGARLVLVITGKGFGDGEGRGVLRQSVPEWLSRPDLRALVVGFTEAGRRHGGGGALYVQIRRRADRSDQDSGR